MDPQEIKLAVFLLLLGSLAVTGLFTMLLLEKYPFLAILLVILLIFLFIVWKTDFLIKLEEWERAVVLRFGRFVGVRGPGWILIIPFIEDYKVVDMRHQVVDVPPQEVITKDNIKLKIDAVIYMRVKDPKAAVLNVEDYKEAAIKFVQAALRDVIGEETFEDVLSKIEDINAKLHENLANMAKHWGLEIYSVQIQNVVPPETLLKAMHERRAAEHLKEAARQRALAEKIQIEAVSEASKQMDERTILYYYIKALEKIAEGRATKLIFPLEFSGIVAMVAQQLQGVVPKEKVEKDLSTKYKDLVEAFIKRLKEEK